MTKFVEKQHFSSSGLLSLVGLMAVAIGIISTPWNRELQDQRIETARQKAEVVGYQVAQIYHEASKTEGSLGGSSSRNPASVDGEGGLSLENLRSSGTMGMDPWGEPYRYRILSTEKSGSIRVLVWSSGPNKRVETKNLENEDVSVQGQPIYSGDDMGVVLSVAQN